MWPIEQQVGTKGYIVLFRMESQIAIFPTPMPRIDWSELKALASGVEGGAMNEVEHAQSSTLIIEDFDHSR